jgi:hypothetical protein
MDVYMIDTIKNEFIIASDKGLWFCDLPSQCLEDVKHELIAEGAYHTVTGSPCERYFVAGARTKIVLFEGKSKQMFWSYKL